VHSDIVEVNSSILVNSINKGSKSQVKLSARHVEILYESALSLIEVKLNKLPDQRDATLKQALAVQTSWRGIQTLVGYSRKP
jgi:hypothetical protein